MKIGLIASTYGTNGLVPKYGYEVNYNDIETIRSDYEWLVEQGTDIQMIMIHWGTEYRNQPDYGQKMIQEQLKDMGFDIVLGSHPHVIQPTIEEDSYFCIYSMGNFLSNQRDEFKDLGLIVDLVVEITDSGVVITRTKLVPTWVDKYQSGLLDYRIVRLDSGSGRIEVSEKNHMKLLMDHYEEIIQRQSN